MTSRTPRRRPCGPPPGRHDSLSHLTGIHGVHLGHIEYIATDAPRTTIPGRSGRYSDGSETAFGASTTCRQVPQGERRVMDCIDCHNRAAHTMQTAEDALNRAMAEGAISPDCRGSTRRASNC